MSKIIICGSISAADEILIVKNKLEAAGHKVEIPEGVKDLKLRGRTEVSSIEKAQDKIKNDLIRGYYNKIKQHDIVLIVNPDKRGVKNYIGGNSFIEMAFAHVLKKRLYVLNPLPDLPYVAEILAMQPIVVGGDLSLIK